MDDAKWEKFFELLNEIVNMPGTYQEKAAEVATRAGDGLGDVEEFAAWFE